MFGLMNLFARALGGYCSDFGGRKTSSVLYRGMSGRILVQMSLLMLNGASLILFSYSHDLNISIIIIVFFSLFTEASCGSTFGIVSKNYYMLQKLKMLLKIGADRL